MAMSADAYVLEYLLEQDRLPDDLIKQFYDFLLVQQGDLPPLLKLRLMLRVLRGTANSVDPGTLNTLDYFKRHSLEPLAGSPALPLSALKPPDELYVLIRTEFVVRGLRGRKPDDDVSDVVVILEQSFPPVDENGEPLSEAGQARKRELLEALGDEPGRAKLLDMYPPEAAATAVLVFYQHGREALGPPFLKVAAEDVAVGRYRPYDPQAANGVAGMAAGKGQKGGAKTRKRARNTAAEAEAAGAIADLRQETQKLGTAVGPDPMPAILQAAAAAELVPGATYQAAVQDAANPSLTGGAGAATQQRVVAWQESPGDPIQSTPEPGADLGTPGTEGATSGKGRGGRGSGGPRRRNGRWTEEETNVLIRYVRQLGKGKWKKILEEAGQQFQNRSQVDLKDKWRNLMRQGVVSEADAGSAMVPDGAPGEGFAALQPPEGHMPDEALINAAAGMPAAEQQAGLEADPNAAVIAGHEEALAQNVVEPMDQGMAS